MQRDDAAERAVGQILSQHHVAAALAHTAKAQTLEGLDGLLAGDDRESMTREEFCGRVIEVLSDGRLQPGPA